MKWRNTLVLSLMVAGIWQVGGGLYIPAKAWLAQQLIERAWVNSTQLGDTIKPWPWADTAPVARLIAQAQGEEFYVLSGASGEALAFGPGHLDASAAPGSNGHIVIGGHRDTHFRFLEKAVIGDLLELQSRDGSAQHFYIDALYIVDVTREPLVLIEGESVLTLVTCYPFTGVSTHKNKRFVVTARQRAAKT